MTVDDADMDFGEVEDLNWYPDDGDENANTCPDCSGILTFGWCENCNEYQNNDEEEDEE